MLLIASNLRRTSDKAWIIIGCSPRAEKASPLRKAAIASLTESSTCLVSAMELPWLGKRGCPVAC